MVSGAAAPEQPQVPGPGQLDRLVEMQRLPPSPGSPPGARRPQPFPPTPTGVGADGPGGGWAGRGCFGEAGVEPGPDVVSAVRPPSPFGPGNDDTGGNDTGDAGEAEDLPYVRFAHSPHRTAGPLPAQCPLTVTPRPASPPASPLTGLRQLLQGRVRSTSCAVARGNPAKKRSQTRSHQVVSGSSRSSARPSGTREHRCPPSGQETSCDQHFQASYGATRKTTSRTPGHSPDAPIVHGMQEVGGSNPPGSTEKPSSEGLFYAPEDSSRARSSEITSSRRACSAQPSGVASKPGSRRAGSAPTSSRVWTTATSPS